MHFLFSAVFLFFFFINICFPQDQDASAVSSLPQAGAIKAAVQVNRKEVPQNRTVTCTIKVTWEGDLNRYEIEDVESPSLTNLEELGNSSSNSVGEAAGVMQAVRTYEYTLQPIELGMAYIDGTVIEYKDTKYDQTHQLVTDRLEIKVVKPIKERTAKPFIFAVSTFFFLALVAGLGFVFLKRKKAREAELEKQAQELIPIEERYLTDFKEKVALKSQNVVETFSSLSKIFRSYLSEKYQIPAMEITTKEIASKLIELAISENIISQVDEILNSCDVAKFSGGQVEKGTLERAYTLVEDILNKNKADQLVSVHEEESKKKT